MFYFSVGLGFGIGLGLWYDLGYWLGFGLRFGSGIRAQGLSCKSSITRPLTGGDLESASKIRRNLFFLISLTK